MVGVYADGVRERESLVKDTSHDAMDPRCGGNTVDDLVGKGVEPLAFVDFGLRGVGTFYKGKGGNGTTIFGNHVTDTVGNVCLNLLGRGMVVCPLGGIAL